MSHPDVIDLGAPSAMTAVLATARARIRTILLGFSATEARTLLADLANEFALAEPPPKLPPLTERQRVVLNAITSYIDTHGRSPTLREVRDAIGIRSTFGVREHLTLIERKGYIRVDCVVSRGIRVLARPS